jgi:hypothetical protein
MNFLTKNKSPCLLKYLVIALWLLGGSGAWAGTQPPVGLMANTPYTATGGNTGISPANRAAFTINVLDYGALGDNSTDDTAAINLASAAFRTAAASGKQAVLYFPPLIYKVTGPINLTGIRAKGALVSGYGATIDANFAAAGGTVIDTIYSRYLTVQGLHITTSGVNSPAVGFAIGRLATESSDVMQINDLFVDGSFSVCGVYNRQSETDNWVHLKSWNTSPSGYGLCQDGINHFNVQSTFVTVTSPVDTPYSFDENTFESMDIRNSGGGPGVFMSFTARHSFIGGYIGNTGGSSCGLTIYYANGVSSAPNYLTWDVHEENQADLTDQVCITGTASSATMDGDTFRDHNSQARNSIFKLSGNVSSVVSTNMRIAIGGFLGGATKVFDNPSAWTVSGQYFLPTGATQWNLPASSFNGEGTIGITTSYYGIGTGLSLPNPAPITIIQASGSVTSATPVSSACYTIAGGGSTFQGITFTTSPAGAGATAIGSVASVSTYCLGSGNNIANAGSGYTTGDVVTVLGNTCLSGNIKYTITASSGVVTAVTPLNTSSGCTNLAVEPVSVSGGTGTGLTLQNIGWSANSINITSAGTGYTVAPVGTYTTNANAIPTVGGNHSGTVATTLSNTFTAYGSGFLSLLLNQSGAQLGAAGPSGVPFLSKGALIDASGVRQTLTGTAYTVPANTSLVRFTQTGTIAAQTITLPTALADGQPIQFVNYAGSITALTFSPAINGWANGTALGANTGLRVRWDATSAAWYREQ